MELDDLKQSWNKQSEDELKNLNNKIMELIKYKSYGPLDELKRKFRQQLILMVFFLAIFIYLTIKRPEHLHDFSRWFWMACGLVMVGYFWYNLKITNHLQNTNMPLKESMEKDVELLEKSLKKMDIIGNIFLIATALILEFLIYLHKIHKYNWSPYSSLNDFSSWSLFVRFLVYLGVFAFSFFRQKFPFKNDYRQHIYYLRKLLDKME